MLMDPFYQVMQLVAVLVVIIRILEITLFISSTNYLYRKAASISRPNFLVPQEINMKNTLNEIREELDYLVLRKKHVDHSTSLEKSFNNKAVVAWVLCSSNEDLRAKCEDLFRLLNKDLK